MRDDARIAALERDGFAGPRVGLVLGSGWGHVVETAHVVRAKPYAEIDGFGESTVAGHAGRLVRARIGRREFLAMQGRLHRYEGHPMTRIGAAIATLEGLGVRTLVVTNAAGAVNTAYQVGDLVRITDVIHFMRESPVGSFGTLGVRPVLSERLGALAESAAARAAIPLRRGILFASTGPNYETPAEVRMVRAFGADLVSMSTTPELIAAEALGMESVGFSCVTNMASGVLPGRTLHHDEVIEAMNAARERCAALLAAVLEEIEA
jgi:purine-nucleoside phosphorylase